MTSRSVIVWTLSFVATMFASILHQIRKIAAAAAMLMEKAKAASIKNASINPIHHVHPKHVANSKFHAEMRMTDAAVRSIAGLARMAGTVPMANASKTQHAPPKRATFSKFHAEMRMTDAATPSIAAPARKGGSVPVANALISQPAPPKRAMIS